MIPVLEPFGRSTVNFVDFRYYFTGSGAEIKIVQGSWAGYAMNVGHFLAGDFNGDGKTDIVHFVAGSDHANVWTSLYYGFHC